MEPLNQWIKQSNIIKGIEVAGAEQKIELFVDDVLIYLENPESSLAVLMDAFKYFGMVQSPIFQLGTKSYYKTGIMLIGILSL